MIDYQYIRHYDYSGMRTAPLCIDGHTKGSEKTDRLNAHETGQTCWKGIRIDPFNISDCYLLMDSTGEFQQPFQFVNPV